MGFMIGIDPSTESATDDFGVNTIGCNQTSEGMKYYVWGKADSGGVTAAGYAVLLDSEADADMVDATASAPGTGAGKRLGIPEIAVTANYYAWFQVYGKCDIRVSANCAAFTELTTTATAGQLDDATTAGLEVINGAVLDTANGGSAATASGHLNYPVVGRTL